jgi:hypothetical protein
MVTLTNESKQRKLLPSQKAFEELRKKASEENRPITLEDMKPIHDLEREEFKQGQWKKEVERQKREGERNLEREQLILQTHERMIEAVSDPHDIQFYGEAIKNILRELCDKIEEGLYNQESEQ